MNSRVAFQPGLLQQQPRRPINQQQQQGSGSGEFQPRRGSPVDAGLYPPRPDRQKGEGLVLLQSGSHV